MEGGCISDSDGRNDGRNNGGNDGGNDGRNNGRNDGRNDGSTLFLMMRSMHVMRSALPKLGKSVFAFFPFCCNILGAH